MSTFKTTYDGPALAGDAIAPDRARALLGQVMGYVAVTVAFAALGAYLGRDLSGAIGLVLLIATIPIVVGLHIAAAKGREQLAIGLLFGLGLVIGLAVAPVIADYANGDPSALWQAAGATAVFVAALGAYGYATRRDLSSWGRTLFRALLGLIAFGIVAIFVSIPNSNVIYAVAGLVIFGGFTIYDFNGLRRSTPDGAVPIAAGIFLDVFNVFLLGDGPDALEVIGEQHAPPPPCSARRLLRLPPRCCRSGARNHVGGVPVPAVVRRGALLIRVVVLRRLVQEAGEGRDVHRSAPREPGLDLLQQPWLITGAGRGMGVDFAQAALAAGHNVVATGRTPETVRSAIGEHERLLVTGLDITDERSAERAVAATVARCGRLDVLVNNAGNFFGGFFEELSPQQVRSQIETNLFGPMTVTRAALPVMRKQRSGLVISISSTAGVVGGAFASAYAASKFGLEGWIEGLTGEVEPYGIRTMIVEPGFFRTELLQPESTTFGELSIDDYAERTAETIPAWQAMNGRQAGDPAKLARALVELADSDEPPLRWVAGEDAVEGIEQKARLLLEQVDAHRELSSNLAHDDVAAVA